VFNIISNFKSLRNKSRNTVFSIPGFASYPIF
jgi:hypothetical protein